MAESTQLAFRSLKGVGLLNAAPAYERVSKFDPPEGKVRCTSYSPDGRFFAWASPEQVSVVNAATGEHATSLPARDVFELGFSPLGTFVITWQRPTKDENGDAVKNLKVWRTLDDSAGDGGERNVVGKFVQKNQTGWNLQYTSDEDFCARVVTNEVQFYRSADLGTVWNKLRVEGVTDFAVAPGKDHAVAVFIPERKGQPAAVKVFTVPNFDSAVSQKTFFKGDKVQLKWNNLGTSLIVLAQTDVDKSNRSYYGETNLYILSTNGGFDSRIQLDKEGPIHDVTWSPSSKEFGIIYGYMPAKTTIFNTKAEPIHNFSLAPRNTILFSPHGKFVLVAGFGNLAGQLDIYDLEKDYAKVALIEASNASVCEWSPDGKHILTATTSPRLRVDNGIRMWHVTGSLMYHEEMTELYDVSWRPQSTTKHPLGNSWSSCPAPHASAQDFLGKVKTPAKAAGAYRPPGARGTTTPLHFKREDEGGAAFSSNGTGPSAVNGFGSRSRREVPGAERVEEKSLPAGAAPGGGVSLTVENEEGLSKAALKNKKKREAKKAKEAAAGAGEGSGGNEEQRRNGLLDPTSPPQRRHRSRSRRGGDDDGRSRSRQGSRSRHDDRRARSSNRRGDASPSPSPGVRRVHPSRLEAAAAAGQNVVSSSEPMQQQQQQQSRPASSKTPRLPPGLAPLNPSAFAPNAGLQHPPQQQSTNGTSTTAGAPKQHSQHQQQQPPIPSIAETLASPTSGTGGTPHDKKIRALTKKIRAIEELKMRQAGGEALELSQLSKIETEERVRGELEGLGGGGGG